MSEYLHLKRSQMRDAGVDILVWSGGNLATIAVCVNNYSDDLAAQSELHYRCALLESLL